LSSAEPPRSGVYTRANFLSIYLPSITLAIGTGMVIPALPVYARSFGVSFEVASLVIVMQQLGSTLSALPTGLLADRFGRRKIVLAGPVLLALSSLLIISPFWEHSFPELLVLRFIGGVGDQMWRLGRLTMIADTGATSERGRQITTMSAMENSGRLISPIVGGLLAGFWDIRAPFAAHALLALLSIIPSFTLLRETAPQLRSGAARDRSPGTPQAGFIALLTFAVVAFFSAQILASLTRGPIFTGQFNLYGAFAYDLNPQTIGVLATVVTALSIPISISTGHIMDRYGRKTTLVPGFSLLALAMGFMAYTAWVQVPFNVFVVAYFSVYATNSITGGNMQTLGSDIAPANARGRFYGVWQTLGSVGGPIGTSAFAALSGAVGYWAAFSFLGTTAASAAFILGVLVPERMRHEETTTGAGSPGSAEAGPASGPGPPSEARV
jgi:MFS family permease